VSGSRAGSQRRHSLCFCNSAADTARSIVSALEGAMLVARPYGAVERFDTAAAQLLASLAGSE